MIFEIFKVATGLPIDFVRSEQAAQYWIKNYPTLDYSKATTGFYIKRNGRFDGKSFHSSEAARKHCDMENMASDYATFTFVEVR